MEHRRPQRDLAGNTGNQRHRYVHHEDVDPYSYRPTSLPPAYDHRDPETDIEGYADEEEEDIDDYYGEGAESDYYDHHDKHRYTEQPSAQYLAPPSLQPRGSQRHHVPGGAAGRGAGSNAYSRRPSTIPDTPSMYSDPYEYQSSAGHTAMTAAVAATPALAPYQDGTHEYPSHNGGQTELSQVDEERIEEDAYYRGLMRKDTLRPGDSISAYNVPVASSRAVPPPMPSPPHHRQMSQYGHAYSTSYDAVDAAQDGFRTYHNGPMGPGGEAGSHLQYDSNATTAPIYANDYGYHPDAKSTSHGHGHGPEMTASDYYRYSTGAPYYSASNGAVHDSDAFPMGYANDEYEHDRQLKEEHGYYDHGHAYATVPNAPGLFSNQMADVGGGGGHTRNKSNFEDDEENVSKRGLRGLKKDSLHTQIEKRRRGIGRQRWPILTWIFAIAYVAVFIVELIKAKNETGQAVQTHPYLNPMIGPSTVFQISFGARFVPCMRETPAVPLTTSLVCPSASTKATSSYSDSDICPLWQICGLPNDHTYGQQYRLISAMFVHAGFVHIIFNLVVQLTLCGQIEKLLGSIFYTIVYVLGGLGGNLLGGNFGLVASPSVGASGAIYSCIAVELVDLLYNWRYEYRAKMRLCLSVLFTLLGLALGLLPGLDNFAHIGGLAVGLLLGMALSPSIHETKRHRVIIWIFRFIGLALCVGYFVALGLNFYKSEDPTKACSWCRYLSCLPTFNQCKNNGLSLTTTTTSSNSSSRRDLFML